MGTRTTFIGLPNSEVSLTAYLHSVFISLYVPSLDPTPFRATVACHCVPIVALLSRGLLDQLVPTATKAYVDARVVGAAVAEKYEKKERGKKTNEKKKLKDNWEQRTSTRQQKPGFQTKQYVS